MTKRRLFGFNEVNAVLEFSLFTCVECFYRAVVTHNSGVYGTLSTLVLVFAEYVVFVHNVFIVRG